MANLIPNELDALIKEYLTDGVLTAKEREVVLKKAVSMGLDRDEIDLYLDAQVQKIEQSADAAARRQKGKACPYCGASIPQLTDKCPHCGQDITADANQDLQEIFDKLEEALVDLKDAQAYKRNKAIIERYARKAKMYYGSNPKVQTLLQEIEIETEKAEKQAKSAAAKQTFTNLVKNKWVLCAIAVLCLFGFIFTCSRQSRAAADTAAEAASIQCDSLCALLDNLEIPDATNYKQVENQLLKITWKDIPNDESEFKESYLEKKRAIAEQISAVDIGGEEYEYKGAPDFISYPSLYINN